MNNIYMNMLNQLKKAVKSVLNEKRLLVQPDDITLEAYNSYVTQKINDGIHDAILCHNSEKNEYMEEFKEIYEQGAGIDRFEAYAQTITDPIKILCMCYFTRHRGPYENPVLYDIFLGKCVELCGLLYDNVKNSPDFQAHLQKTTEEYKQLSDEYHGINFSLYPVTEKDWLRIIEYKNNACDAEEVLEKCRSPKKIVATYIVAYMLGMRDYMYPLRRDIQNREILTEGEIMALEDHYKELGVPDSVLNIINDLIENDTAGGFYIQKEMKNNLIYNNNAMILRNILNSVPEIITFRRYNPGADKPANYDKIYKNYTVYQVDTTKGPFYLVCKNDITQSTFISEKTFLNKQNDNWTIKEPLQYRSLETLIQFIKQQIKNAANN